MEVYIYSYHLTGDLFVLDSPLDDDTAYCRSYVKFVMKLIPKLKMVGDIIWRLIGDGLFYFRHSFLS